MINFEPFYQRLVQFELDEHKEAFAEHIIQGLSTQRHGDLTAWLAALDALPATPSAELNCKDTVAVSSEIALPEDARQQIEQSLRALIPWRKGPFTVFDVHIDTEWRSDWKWDRVLPHLSNLQGRTVLDVGCGSGYHCWRMYGEGARWVLGIDPSPRFIVQFEMIKHFSADAPVDVIPLGIEQLPGSLNFFDTVFSMGVLYHRISPMEHLRELKDALRAGGELVLETLVIEGKLGDTLVPEGRYAMMRNVWFIPSIDTLLSWLQKCGFENARCVDKNTTTRDEQRRTEWMKFHSLNEFLHETDKSKTIEGHPAPMRAVIVANKPGQPTSD